MKIFERDSGHGKREKEIYNHLAKLKSSHTGSLLVRSTRDHFEIESVDESSYHQYLVHEPLAMTLFELRNRVAGKVLLENLLKPTLIHILLALDFLHTEAGVIYTGENSCISQLAVPQY